MKQAYLDRFFNYISFDSQSDDNSETVPSTPGQKILAQALYQELCAMGLDQATLDDNGYVTAKLAACGRSCGRNPCHWFYCSYGHRSRCFRSQCLASPQMRKLAGAPIIFTGGHNFHGVHEYLVLDFALKSVNTVVEIARLTAEQYRR